VTITFPKPPSRGRGERRGVRQRHRGPSCASATAASSRGETWRPGTATTLGRAVRRAPELRARQTPTTGAFARLRVGYGAQSQPRSASSRRRGLASCLRAGTMCAPVLTAAGKRFATAPFRASCRAVWEPQGSILAAPSRRPRIRLSRRDVPLVGASGSPPTRRPRLSGTKMTALGGDRAVLPCPAGVLPGGVDPDRHTRSSASRCGCSSERRIRDFRCWALLLSGRCVAWSAWTATGS